MAIRVRFDPQAFVKVEMTKRSVHRVVFASHVDLDRNVRDQNPFDTGFSANSWFPQVDGSGVNPSPPEKGVQQPDPGTSDPARLLASVGHVLTLANSAAYIRRLNDGYSPQAPEGWVDMIANEYQDYVDRHIMIENGKNRSKGGGK